MDYLHIIFSVTLAWDRAGAWEEQGHRITRCREGISVRQKHGRGIQVWECEGPGACEGTTPQGPWRERNEGG